MRRAPGVLLGLFALLTVAGCARLTAVDPDSAFSDPPGRIGVEGVPYHPQEALQCGPAALAETLGWSGHDVTPAALESDLFIPAREGTLQTEMLAQARARGRVAYRLEGGLDALVAELEAGHPVLVFQNLGLDWVPVWHYAVVVGYEPEQPAFVLRSGAKKAHHSGLDRFRRTWERTDQWAVVTMPPDRLPATAEPGAWLNAALDLEETGQGEAALTAYRTGRTRWPESGAFHLALVNLHYQQDDLEAAEAAARQGLEQAEERRNVLRNNLANILVETDDCGEAERLARRAVAESDDGPFVGDFRATLERAREAHADGACNAAGHREDVQ